MCCIIFYFKFAVRDCLHLNPRKYIASSGDRYTCPSKFVLFFLLVISLKYSTIMNSYITRFDLSMNIGVNLALPIMQNLGIRDKFEKCLLF